MCSRVSGGCIVVDQQCRESNGKAKIEGYTRVSDEQAHYRAVLVDPKPRTMDSVGSGPLGHIFHSENFIFG